ncbi:phage replication initiation protein [Enterococcus sp. AZ135]|uniref:replisome organizer n=1 Tax=unclassified Enterococcus TaxID=2608891 RepID=UPI003F26EDC8
MAERRMFAKTIIDSDAFLDMPLSTQALYFHLSMRADDDGFINNPKKIQRMVGSSEDDLKLLNAKRFIIAFESGVIVIKHWKIHNYIQKDRYKPTLYQEERAMLSDKNNKSYTTETECIQDGYSSETQVRLGKDRLELGKDRKDVTPPPSKPVPVRHKYGEYKNVLLSDQELGKLKKEFPIDWQKRIENVSEYCAMSGRTYKNYLVVIRKWAKNDKDQQNVTPRKQAYTTNKPRSESYVTMQYNVYIREKQFDPNLTLEEYGKRKKLKQDELIELKAFIAKNGGG